MYKHKRYIWTSVVSFTGMSLTLDPHVV